MAGEGLLGERTSLSLKLSSSSLVVVLKVSSRHAIIASRLARTKLWTCRRTEPTRDRLDLQRFIEERERETELMHSYNTEISRGRTIRRRRLLGSSQRENETKRDASTKKKRENAKTKQETKHREIEYNETRANI